MSIYLAWSVYKVLGFTLFTIVLSSLMFWGNLKFNTPQLNKFVWIWIVLMAVVMIFSAFNIGDRQQELGRSNFNASAPETVDKIETNQQNIDSVKQAFEQAVKK